MEVVVTTGAARRANLQPNRHHQQTTIQAGCTFCTFSCKFADNGCLKCFIVIIIIIIIITVKQSSAKNYATYWHNTNTTFVLSHQLIMPPPLTNGGIMRCSCLTSVCVTSVCRLSVAYIGPKSRTVRPRKTKSGTEVAHVTRDSDTTFNVKRSKVKVTRLLLLAVQVNT